MIIRGRCSLMFYLWIAAWAAIWMGVLQPPLAPPLPRAEANDIVKLIFGGFRKYITPGIMSSLDFYVPESFVPDPALRLNYWSEDQEIPFGSKIVWDATVSNAAFRWEEIYQCISDRNTTVWDGADKRGAKLDKGDPLGGYRVINVTRGKHASIELDTSLLGTGSRTFAVFTKGSRGFNPAEHFIKVRIGPVPSNLRKFQTSGTTPTPPPPDSDQASTPPVPQPPASPPPPPKPRVTVDGLALEDGDTIVVTPAKARAVAAERAKFRIFREEETTPLYTSGGGIGLVRLQVKPAHTKGLLPGNYRLEVDLADGESLQLFIEVRGDR